MQPQICRSDYFVTILIAQWFHRLLFHQCFLMTRMSCTSSFSTSGAACHKSPGNSSSEDIGKKNSWKLYFSVPFSPTYKRLHRKCFFCNVCEVFITAHSENTCERPLFVLIQYLFSLFISTNPFHT